MKEMRCDVVTTVVSVAFEVKRRGDDCEVKMDAKFSSLPWCQLLMAFA